MLTVIDKEGTNLFHIDHIPPLGSTLHYCVNWQMLEAGNIEKYSKDTIKHWKEIDGKTWVVKDVLCEVRNYNGKERSVLFVEVEERECKTD